MQAYLDSPECKGWERFLSCSSQASDTGVVGDKNRELASEMQLGPATCKVGAKHLRCFNGAAAMVSDGPAATK